MSRSVHLRRARMLLRLPLLLLLVATRCRSSHGATLRPSQPADVYSFPGLMDTTYAQLGDINIGATVMVTTPSAAHPAASCAQELNNHHLTLETTESIAFATDLVNRNPNLLPNVTLGFIIRGACTSIAVTLGTYLSFLPRNRDSSMYNGSSSCSSQTADSCWQGNDVIGTIGSSRSKLTEPVSSLYALAKLPILGATETSDEFSDKGKHPYFFRVVPPDVHMVQAILHFIHSNGWSYISVLYLDGAYGQDAFDNLRQRTSKYGICIATSHRLLYNTDYNEVVSDLLRNSKARPVVLFLLDSSFRKILQAVVDKNATGHFIWVGSSGLVNYAGHEYKGTTKEPGIGTFIFENYSTFVTDYFEYLKKQNVLTSKNPWMRPLWEFLFECSFALGTCDTDTNLLQSSKYQPYKSAPLRIDSVLALAQAAHNLLAERCPDARGKDARACITGELLREYMKNTSFEGYTGRVEFDGNQEVKGRYIISQLNNDQTGVSISNSSSKLLLPKGLGIYDVSSDTINYFNDSISWSHLNVLERIYPWTEEGSLPKEVPESVCSGPCKAGEYKIAGAQPCCWECRRCRDNERLVDANTRCEACPAFTWPDPTSAFTTCVDIPPTYSTLADSIPIALTSLTLFVLAIYAFVVIGYIAYRNERVIKASSRELSVLQLIAILGGYATVLLFQMMPTDATCTAIFFLFCMSFVLLYAPLLVKTIRIFRIFQSGKTNNQRLRFISPESQFVIAGFLIALQVALCVVNFYLFSPGAQRTQPIWSEKYVELSCDLTLPGLASFLGYNFVLICMCSVFAFKVRKLPDNFNESQFISMCVSTTLLIWLAFVPTYFTADREYIRAFLLSTALLLNHSVALLLLFIPKIYAARFLSLDSSSGKTAN